MWFCCSLASSSDEEVALERSVWLILRCGVRFFDGPIRQGHESLLEWLTDPNFGQGTVVYQFLDSFLKSLIKLIWIYLPGSCTWFNLNNKFVVFNNSAMPVPAHFSARFKVIIMICLQEEAKNCYYFRKKPKLCVPSTWWDSHTKDQFRLSRVCVFELYRACCTAANSDARSSR